jgi:hypothetical protein
MAKKIPKLIAVGDFTTSDAQGATSSHEGFATREGLVPHAVRQALQSLDDEIDAHDRIDEAAVDRDELLYAYAKFAGPHKLREES